MSDESAFETVMKAIDEVTDPKKMTKAEYRDFLEELMSDLEGRLDAVMRELEEEEEEEEETDEEEEEEEESGG